MGLMAMLNIPTSAFRLHNAACFTGYLQSQIVRIGSKVAADPPFIVTVCYSASRSFLPSPASNASKFCRPSHPQNCCRFPMNLLTLLSYAEADPYACSIAHHR